MKKILILLISLFLTSPLYAVEIKVNLTQEEKEALNQMLGEQTIEQYLKAVAKSHIIQNLNEEFLKKTKEDKEKLLKK